MADRQAEERRRRQRAKNWALVAVLFALVALIYLISIVRMSGA
jgi:fatty acid desaturase